MRIGNSCGRGGGGMRDEKEIGKEEILSKPISWIKRSRHTDLAYYAQLILGTVRPESCQNLAIQ